MKHVLCCDASTDEVSISWTVYDDAEIIVDTAIVSYKLSRTRGRNEFFVPAVEHVRTLVNGTYDALSCICCTTGPGSFTGLRNVFAFVKGLLASHKHHAPLQAVGVRTHDAIAHCYKHALTKEKPLLVLTDARSNRYYGALYHHEYKNTNDIALYQSVEIHDYKIDDIIALVKPCASLHCVGNTNIVPTLASRIPTCTITSLESTSYTIIEAVRALGLFYYHENIHTITTLSEPLYIRAAV